MDRCIVCGEPVPEGRQICPKHGNEGTAFESLMKRKDIQFEIDDRIESAFRSGFEEGKRQVEEKHWNECRQISEYQAENKRLKELLIEMSRWVKCSLDPVCIVWWDDNKDRVVQLIGGGENG